jgi:hypothetical protein
VTGQQAPAIEIGHDDRIFASIHPPTAAQRVDWRRRAARAAFERYPHVAGADCSARMIEFLQGKRSEGHECTCPNAAEREQWLGEVLDMMQLRDRSTFLADLQEALRALRRKWVHERARH